MLLSKAVLKHSTNNSSIQPAIFLIHHNTSANALLMELWKRQNKRVTVGCDNL